ncbi:MAG: alpha-xylosidase [Prevotella sp.]|nr:alpha-xylosidase [Prevotella sp.]
MNYYIDFLDFDPQQQGDEYLWKAYRPVSITEQGGDILLRVPFVRQAPGNEMAPHPDGGRQEHTIVVRYYEPGIVRVFADFEHPGNTQPADSDDMLQYSARVKRVPLHVETDDNCLYASTPDGVRRAVLSRPEAPTDHWSDLLPPPQETLDLTLLPDGKTEVRLAAYDHFSPPRYDALPVAFCQKKDDQLWATISFECRPDECFAGTGERFMKMDLSGQTFFLKNQDGQGVNNRRTYKNIPFYVSSRLYGVYYHTTAYGKLSLAGQSTRSVQFLSEQGLVDAFIIGGESLGDIVRGYRDLTGYPAMPPLWSFGVWMSRMTYFSSHEVEDICQRLRREHFPCDVIHLDTGWFKTDWLCEWKFNEERFPDPPAFIQRLRAQGFRVSLWQLPYVAEDAEQIDEARRHNYIAPLTETQRTEGSNFSALDYAGTIDFTSTEATRWYQQLLRRLLQMGVACIKTDFGENIHLDAHYQNMPARLLNNLYALLYQKAAFDVTKEVTGQGIVWARAAWAGCQRFPLHWGGDSASSWDGMAGSLKGGLHFGLSGFAFWSHDVPGFHSLPDFMNGVVDDKVYVRWTQFGVFTSHIRYHGTSKREPWHFPRVSDIVRRWWRLRYALIPYIVEESREACRSGLPVLQALVFHHPHDKTCWHIDDQYYFGRQFLVCPVMNGEGRRQVYLPEGEWVHFFTGEHFEGRQWLNFENIPLEIMPVFVKAGAEIPVFPYEVDCTDDMDLLKSQTLTIDNRFSGYPL